jgi:biopolymer transport protein ExbB/TolQ
METAVAFLPLATLGEAFLKTHWAGQVMVVVLAAGSVYIWTVLALKWRQMGDADGSSQRFLKAYRKEGPPAGVLMKRLHFEPSPLYAVYEKACGTLGVQLQSQGTDANDLFLGEIGSGRRRYLSGLQLASVRDAARITLNDAFSALDDHMGFLSVSGRVVPLLGCLGMLWGIVLALSGEGAAALTSFAAFAPVLGGCVLAAAVALLVALPTIVGHSVLAEKQRRLRTLAENFVEELLSDMHREYLEQGGEQSPKSARTS